MDFIIDILKTVKHAIENVMSIWHFIIIVAMVILFVIIVIVIARSYRKSMNSLNLSINHENDISHMKVDLAIGNVLRFSRLNMSSTKTVSVEEFYGVYPQENGEKLAHWFDDLLNNDSTPKSLEFSGYSKLDHAYSQDTFEVTHIEKEKKAIFLDHLVSSKAGKKGSLSKYLKKMYEMEDILYHQKLSNPILLAYITFFTTNDLIKNEDYHLSVINSRQITNLILKQCDNDHMVVELENGDLALYITSYDKKKDKFIAGIVAAIDRYYAVNSLNNQSYHICYLTSVNVPFQYKHELKKLKTLSKFNLDNHTFNEKVIPYVEGTNYISDKEKKDLEIVNQSLSLKQFNFEYIPYFDKKNGNIESFKLRVIPRNPGVENFGHFLKICTSSMKEKEYISLLMSTIEEAYASLDPGKKKFSKKIAISLNPSYIHTLLGMSKEITTEMFGYQIVIILKNSLLSEYLQFNPGFEQDMKLLMERCEGIISFRSEIVRPFLFHSSLNELISSYTVESGNFHSFMMDSTDRIMMNNIFIDIDSLNKPIYSTGIKDWAICETMLTHNISYYSGRLFEADVTAICLDTPKKNVTHIRELYSKHFV